MANYPQLDNASGVWKLREVYDAVMGGYWPNANAIGLYGGGSTPGAISVIDKITLATSGNATVFGNLSVGAFSGATGQGLGSFVRGVLPLGYNGSSNLSTIDYVTFSTEGNAADFGDTTSARYAMGCSSNTVRGINGGGHTSSNVNTIDYVTIISTGNAIDFGDLSSSRITSGSSSPTRSIFGGGVTPSLVNTVDFVEIATTGNATDFGDLNATGHSHGTASSSVRSVYAGGSTPSEVNTLQFLTIASQGNAIDYGDLTQSRSHLQGVSNSVKGIFLGGLTPSIVNTIDEIVINNGGAATDFGDLSSNKRSGIPSCNSHGGLNDGYQGTRPLPFNEAGGDLGLYFGGEPASSPIQFINISSTGNANDFSGVTVGAIDTNGGGNKTRGMIYSGNDGSGNTDDIKYVEFATKGNVAFFGNATAAKQIAACASNNTRLLAGGGATPSNVNNIDQITISTFANASDFGDLTASRKPLGAGSSNTRAVWGGGNNPDPTNVMDYVTISTTGNAADFGDLTVARRNGASANSSTRILFAGGRSNPSPAAESNVIDYITTATTGNATDFGDLTSSRIGVRGVSNTTRGCFMGGTETPGGNVNIIDFVTIDSTGNASDFGDIIAAGRGGATASNGHGGLVGG